ncbi:MAG: SseB family protein [Clostridiales bacterium]|nr:SseB family protein [Clostridiales bacterium]
MALFGKKNDDENKNIEQTDDLDALIMSAIEETDLEEQQLREEKIAKANERAEAMAKAREEALEREKKLEEMKKSLPNEGRRFFLVVEDQDGFETDVKIVGNLHGTMKVDDKVFIYKPDYKVTPAVVKEIEDCEGDESTKSSDPKSRRVTVTLAVPVPETIPEFSVVASSKPDTTGDKKIPAENPALLGLSMEYKRFSKEHKFTEALMTAILNGKFLVAGMPKEEQNADGKKALSLISLNDPRAKNGIMLPIFTDPAALAMWKELMKREKKPVVLVMDFKDAVKQTSAKSMDFIINPYGPAPMKLPREVIDRITNTPDFKNWASGLNERRKEDTNKSLATKIIIGELPTSPESEAVKKTLIRYCSGNPDVEKAGVAAKIHGKNSAYLFIIDCKAGKEKEIFTALFKEIKPLISDNRNIEFSLYKDTVFAEDYFSKHPIDYRK